MKLPRSPRMDWFGLVALVCLVLGEPAAGQETGADVSGGDAALKFRRVYAPADAVQDWPRGAARYVPVEPDEFERLVRRATDVPRGAKVSPVAHLVRAVYEARYDGGDTLAGRATLDVRHVGDGAAVMPLAPCGVALEGASWRQAERGSPATLGLGDDGRLLALAPTSGQLRLDWSLRGRREMGGGVSFPVVLPACPATTIFLDLPEERRPVVDRGVVTHTSLAGSGRVRWQIELGGLNRLTLRLASREAASGPRRSSRLREAVTYDASVRGVDVSAQWKLDIHGEPLRRLEVELDAGLRLVTARYGDADAAWSVTPGNDANSSRVTIEFPEPIVGVDRVVRLAAVAPLTLDQTSRLPRIRAQTLEWREGTINVLVRSPLVVEDLLLEGCQQTHAGPLPAPSGGESIELQSFGPEATVALAVGRRRQPIQVSSGSTVWLGGEVAVAETLAELRSAETGRFALEASVPQSWRIDSVRAIPPEILADWDFQPGDSASGVLRMRLARPLGPNSPAKLLIRGSMLLPPAAADAVLPTVDLASLDLVRFRSALAALRLMALVTDERNRLRLNEAKDASRTSADALTPYEQALLAEEDRADHILRLSSEAPRGDVTLERERPAYAAKVRVRASVSADRLTEEYSMLCTTETKPVDRVLVRFTPPRGDPLRWSLGEDDRRALTARRVTDAGGAGAENGQTGEVWEVRLARPQVAPFELRATRATAHTGVISPSLAVLPEASTQQGLLVVAAPPEISLAVTNRSLRQVELEPHAPGEFSIDRAAYRFEPTNDAAGLNITTATAPAEQVAAWAWSCQIDTRLLTDGRMQHWVAYAIENRGRSRAAIRVPAGLDVTGLSIDGRAMETAVEQDRLNFQLPPQKKHVNLVVRCQSVGRPIGWFTTIEAPRLELDLPVLATRLRLWASPGYEVLRSSRTARGTRPARLSWTQRLFGPLGRGADSPPFDPLDSGDWRWIVGTDEDRATARTIARDFAQRLTAAASSTETEPANWSEVLVRANADAPSPTPSLLVDWQALDEAGIGPLSHVPKPAEIDPSDAPMALLQRAGLRLLILGDVVVLTTHSAAVVDAAQLDPIDPAALDSIRPGALADEVRAAWHGAAGRYVTPQRWSEVTDGPSLDAVADDAPWTEDLTADVIVIEPGPDTSMWATVAPRSLVDTAGWAVFALVVSGAAWLLRKREGVLLIMAGVFVALALVLPDAYAPLASGGVLGTVISILVVPWLPRPAAQVDRESAEQPSLLGPRILRPVQTAVSLIACGMIATCTIASRAQEPPESKARDDAHRVFIPVNEKDEPTGGKYQVPQEFYRELQRRAAAAAGEPQGWLLQSAHYRARLARGGLLPRAALQDLAATLELQVFADGTRVRLPLGNSGVDVAPDGALLDGRPVALDRDAGGRTMSLEIAEAGPHRLDLSLRADVRITASASTLDFPIPPLATSTLELSLPDNPPEVELPEALGSRSAAPGEQKLSARLGPADRLVLRWSERPARTEENATVEVDELLWLRVQQGAVVLDCRFKFKVRTGQLRQLQFAMDPRLRPLPIDAQDSSVTLVEGAGDAAMTRVDLARPVSDQITVPLRFLFTGASGIGTLDIPRVEAMAARSTRRWLAISVDPSLEFKADTVAADAAVTVGDFVGQWGLVASPPQLAFRPPKEAGGWRLTARPRLRSVSAGQSLDIGGQSGGLAVRWEALLDSAAGLPPAMVGRALQYRVVAPPEFRVDTASVLEDGVDRLVRWAQSPGGEIVLFIATPASAPRKLTVRGWVPAPQSGAAALPLLRLADVEARQSILRLWRQADVSVVVHDPVGLVESNETTRSDDAHGLGRLVGSYRVEGPDARAMLSIARNEPQIVANQATTISRDGDRWQATIDYRCHVENGVLDQLSFDVPSTWPGPYEVTPAAAHEVVSSGVVDRRRLIVRPRAAIEGDYHLTIRGPLAAVASGRVAAPDVVPASGGSTNRYFLLPTRIDLRRLRWETSGLREAPLPEGLVQLPPPWSAAFIASVDSPQAEIVSSQDSAELGSVRLAHVRVAWQADGTYVGLAAFDLSVAAEAGCNLQLPDNIRIRHMSVAGRPLSVPSGSGPCYVPLAVGEPRQRIEILFASDAAAELRSGQPVFAAPEIEQWQVERSQWTVFSPTAAGQGAATILPTSGDSSAAAVAEGEMASGGTDSNVLADAALGRWRGATRLTASGKVARLAVAYPSAVGGDWPQRAAAAILALVACLWLSSHRRRGPALGFLAQWPYATLVVAGIAWWLWLAPSAAGLLLVALAVAGAIRELSHAGPRRGPMARYGGRAN